MRSSVDLPEPLGPSSPIRAPSAISRSAPVRMGREPNDCAIPRALSRWAGAICRPYGNGARRSGGVAVGPGGAASDLAAPEPGDDAALDATIVALGRAVLAERHPLRDVAVHVVVRAGHGRPISRQATALLDLRWTR